MKRHQLILTALAGVTLWSAAAFGKGFFAIPRDAPGFFPAPRDTPEAALQNAHAAYMQKNYSALTNAVRDLLANPETDVVARQGAFALLQKANAETNGHLPADWRLPAGVSNMKFKQYRKVEPDGIIFAAGLQATIATVDTLAELRLTRWPSQVLLDKQKGIGKWEVTRDDDGYSFDFYAGDKAEPLAEGLYAIDMVLQDGTRTSGWFILNDLEASASPVVEAPAVGETLSESTPELHWQDFRSPEYKPYESRVLALAVTALKGADTAWDKPDWEFYQADPTSTQMTVDKPLADGKYWVSVSYQERRWFGPLRLCRSARSGRPFYIKSK